MTDIVISAFSLFFMQSASFLSYQHSLEEGGKSSNRQSFIHRVKIPTDNPARSMPNPVAPKLVQTAFDQMFAALQDGRGLENFQRLDRRILVASDGTECLRSQKFGRPRRQTQKHANGRTDYYHSMLAATIVAPGHNVAKVNRIRPKLWSVSVLSAVYVVKEPNPSRRKPVNSEPHVAQRRQNSARRLA